MRFNPDIDNRPPSRDWLILALAAAAMILCGATPALALTLDAVTVEGTRPDLEKVPLTYQRLDVVIHNQVAASQHFVHVRNDLEEDVEVTCLLATAHDELVEGFSYWNGEERIVGEVLEKQVATEIYEDLTQVQRDPGILEQTAQGFRFRVYPVQPGEDKPVEVRTMRPMDLREGIVEYVIPRENLHDGGVLTLSVDITDELPISEVEVEGIDAEIERLGAHHQVVVFETGALALVGDVTIRYRLRSEETAMRFTAHRSGGADGSFMLLVSPRDLVEDTEVIGRDIVFVVDVSGSMGGVPLEQTKVALDYIIRALHPSDRFNVLSFSDDSELAFGTLVPAQSSMKGAALAAVAALETRGGTNIRGALDRAVQELESNRSHRPPAIIFLTDGQGNSPPAQILADLRRTGSHARVFTFGAGDGVNRRFLERLARENRGSAVMVDHADAIEDGMRRLYDRIAMPLMVDLDLEFEGLDVTAVYPRRLPDLYRDGQVTVFGRFENPGIGRIRLSGTVLGREETLSMDVVLPADQEKHAYVEKLWAQERVDHCMDLLADRGDAPELVNEITRLGIVYNLVTDYTTFLALPESLKTADIKEKIRQGTLGYDKKIIDGFEDVRLSMQDIPPGDPVLSVQAPEDARQVVAYFPFGLVKRLRWDPMREHWSARFLVPRDVEDGVYEIRILIVDADGQRRWKTVEYRIDGTEPEFETWVSAFAEPGEVLPIEVDPFEPVVEVVAWLPGQASTPVRLTLDTETGTYRGALTMPDEFPEGGVTVRVQVRDRARNRHEQNFEILEDDGLEHDHDCGC